jgi:hypothetical protein
MEPETRNVDQSGETAHLLHQSGETVQLLHGTPAPVIRRGSSANRPVKNGGSRQEHGQKAFTFAFNAELSNSYTILQLNKPILNLNKLIT